MPVPNVVIASIHDGFGNQLFQYSACLALAQHLGVPLKLDLRGVELTGRRPYMLHHLNIQAPEASASELAALAPRPSVLDRAWKKLTGRERTVRLRPLRQFREQLYYHYDDSLFECRAPIWVDGFFQSERYLARIEPRLHHEFRITTPPSAGARELLSEIEGCQSVCVHVRREDYTASSIFHNVGMEYYASAARELAASIENPVFFVFSDDPKWTQENLQLPGQVRWTWATERLPLIDDFRLMGACRHAIIANSTLSWWARRLNPKPDERVYLPARWFEPTEWGPPELYTDGWIAH